MVLLAVAILFSFCLLKLANYSLTIIRLPRLPLAAFFDFLPSKKKCRHQQLMEWSRRHGRTFYTLNGFSRNFVSSDPAVLTEVFGLDLFVHFPERKEQTELAENQRHVFVASGERWKRLRKEVSLFSGHNLRAMDPLLQMAVHEMLETMAAQKGEPFDFQRCSNLLFASILARLAFLTAFPNGQLEEFPCKFVDIAEQLLQQRNEAKAAKWTWWNIFSVSGKPHKIDVFSCLYRNILETTEADSTPNNSIQQKEHSSSEGEIRVETKLGRLLLDKSMKAVGIQTVTFALGCCVHFLAANLKIQDELRAEFHESDEPELLMACIKETLRLSPIVAFASARRCVSDTVLPNGIQIRAGDTFEGDIFSMGRDPMLWGQDADKFHPERWLCHKPSEPTAWLSFGFEPRGCVGVRFSYGLLKLALRQILCRFKLVSMEGGQKNADGPQLIGESGASGGVLFPQNVRIQAWEVKV